MIVKFKTKERLNPPHQTIFNDTSRFKVAAKGRRFGKTYLTVYILITQALTKQGKYFYIAPTFQQARDICWNLLNLTKRSRVRLRHFRQSPGPSLPALGVLSISETRRRALSEAGILFLGHSFPKKISPFLTWLKAALSQSP